MTRPCTNCGAGCVRPDHYCGACAASLRLGPAPARRSTGRPRGRPPTLYTHQGLTLTARQWCARLEITFGAWLYRRRVYAPGDERIFASRAAMAREMGQQLRRAASRAA